MATKYVYFFGNGDAEGDESMRPILNAMCDWGTNYKKSLG